MEARKKTYRKNKEKVLAVSAIYRVAYREREKVVRREHYQNNKADVLAKAAAYRVANLPLYAAAAGKRRASKRHATPAWADLDAIAAIYKEAARVTAMTGQPHEVDHFFPLQSPIVCGLHVAANLRIIPRYDNRSRGNRFEE